MPGPILNLAAAASESNDFSVFESCEDVQEGWGSRNGNFSGESLYHDCNKHLQSDNDMPYVNGGGTRTSPLSPHTDHPALQLPVMEGEKDSTRMVAEMIKVENMELENEVMDDDVVEDMKVPVMEASLSVDISTSLTRQKIASVQHGRTLSFADTDDTEEVPTRRPRPHSLANASRDPPLHPAFAKSETPRNAKMPSSAHRAIRVVRNPSYHFAVRKSASLSPYHTAQSEDGLQSRSCGSSPARAVQAMQTVSEDKGAGEDNRRHTSVGDELTLTLAPGMSRSVSYSGPVALSPTVPGRGSLSEGNSRSGSVSQLSTLSPQNINPLTENKPSPSIVRGSAITRSFRRLFRNPVRSQTSPTSEKYWVGVPELHNSSDSDQKSSSRLQKISTNLTRRLSHRSKMSTSRGTNGLLVPNGSTTPEDARSLVDYEDLLKLFCCTGCKVFMTPPLYQCRKGHLVCNTCRFSLKQVCPQCKQRFAENTNFMMEQVCQLVKFPCKYAEHGCTEFYQPRAKVDHEHFCVYRPVHCHHEPQGCTKVLLLRDMHEHLNQCQYKAK